MLEKNEEQNWQYLAHKIHDEHKEKHNTEKRWAQRTPPKTDLNPDAREKLTLPTSYTVTNIDKSGKNLLGDRGKTKIYVEENQSIAIWDMDIS